MTDPKRLNSEELEEYADMVRGEFDPANKGPAEAMAAIEAHISAIEADHTEALEAVEKESSYYSEMAAGFQDELATMKKAAHLLIHQREVALKLEHQRTEELVVAGAQRDAALTRVRELEGQVHTQSDEFTLREAERGRDEAIQQRNELAQALKEAHMPRFSPRCTCSLCKQTVLALSYLKPDTPEPEGE